MSKLLDSLREYFENTPKEILEEDWKELEHWNEIGPNAEEYCNWVKEQHKNK